MKFYKRKKERNNGVREIKRNIKMMKKMAKTDKNLESQNRGFNKLMTLYARLNRKGV